MKRIVIVGSGGRLGTALVREYAKEFDVVGFNHAQLDLGRPEELRATLGTLEFDALINAAAQTNVDRCETEPDEAFALNGEAPGVLAEICARNKARFIHVSTDYVFDGEKREPYTEEDEARPISVYGKSKREGERRALEANERTLVARVSWVFGPDRPSFVDWAIGQARDREAVSAIADKWATPTYTPDLAAWLRPLIVAGIDDPGRSGKTGISDPGYNSKGDGKTGISDPGYNGIVHLANSGECSWQEYAQWAVDCCRAEGIRMKTETIGAQSLAEMKSFVARRPVYSVLSSEKFAARTGITPRPWREAVAEFVREFVKNNRTT